MSFGSRPQNVGRWTVAGLARHLHVRTKTVQRIWKAYGITRRILWGMGYPEPVVISSDPGFGWRIRALVGLFSIPMTGR